MMINLLRKAIGFIIAGPFWILVKTLSLIVGNHRAIEILGPFVCSIVRIMAEVTMIPKINNPLEFSCFVERLKKNISNLGLLYDVSVEFEDKDTIVLNFKNCPHCEMFKYLGIPELGPYACESDWVIARKNADVWCFERSLQIGTGDKYCNHMYKRKQS